MASSSRLLQLAQWLAGHFNNFDQAIAEPAWFANIHVYQCPLPYSVLEGIGFYVEQAYDIALNQPYRQRVIHLIRDETDQIRIQNYSLTHPERYLGAGRDLDKLTSLTRAELELLSGCVTEVDWTGSSFRGRSIPGKTCLIWRKNRQTYLRSEFEVTATAFQSLDQGLDPETDKVVWGSLSGPFQFVKREDFSPYLSSLIEG